MGLGMRLNLNVPFPIPKGEITVQCMTLNHEQHAEITANQNTSRLAVFRTLDCFSLIASVAVPEGILE